MNLNRTLLFILLSMISEVAFCQYLSLNKYFADFSFQDKPLVESHRAEERFARFLIDVVRLSHLEQSEQVQSLQLYNVRALPTLYLLDKQKRVLLKDVSVEKLIKYLEMI